jgi:plastocyanin
VVSRDTLEALAFGAVLVVLISGSAFGFNALADGDPVLPRGEAGDGGATATDHQGGDHHDGGGHSGDSDRHDGGMDHGGGMDGGMAMDMRMVENGTVINGNVDALPPGCDGVAGERSVTIHGGVEYADGGEMFSFERDRLDLDRCTRVTVTFVNEDAIRHQWMLHGLPTEVYPMGMFNVEVDGTGSATGTFITPGEDVTLNTHCSLPQHEQKGMQMTVVVGEGGDGGGMDH